MDRIKQGTTRDLLIFCLIVYSFRVMGARKGNQNAKKKPNLASTLQGKQLANAAKRGVGRPRKTIAAQPVQPAHEAHLEVSAQQPESAGEAHDYDNNFEEIEIELADNEDSQERDDAATTEIGESSDESVSSTPRPQSSSRDATPLSTASTQSTRETPSRSGTPSTVSTPQSSRRTGNQSNHRSEWWQHFHLSLKNGEEVRQCNYCPTYYINVGGTGNMSGHIEMCHNNKIHITQSQLDKHMRLRYPAPVKNLVLSNQVFKRKKL